MIITELAVFEFINKKLYLTELMPNVTLQQVKEVTPTNYEIQLKEVNFNFKK